MLCEIASSAHFSSPLLEFAVIWAVLTALGGLSIAVLSGSVFYCYYAAPTFEQWQLKLNPAFPSPAKIKLEIVQTTKGLMAATLCPALALFLSQPHNFKLSPLPAQAYCGVEPHFGLSGAAYLGVQFMVFWVLSDFYE